jgi:hypothetical protein
MSEPEPTESVWPYSEPHIIFKRFRVTIPGGGSAKGLDRETAIEVAYELEGTVHCSTVVFIIGGPDAGTEVLGRWKRIHPPAHMQVVDTITTTEVI